MDCIVDALAKSRTRLKDLAAAAGLYNPWNLPGKNTGVGHQFFSPGYLPDPGTEPGSLIAQLVKNPPAMQETLVQFLGWEDLLEKG